MDLGDLDAVGSEDLGLCAIGDFGVGGDGWRASTLYSSLVAMPSSNASSLSEESGWA